MNVSFSVLWRLNLDDQIYILNIKTSRSNICCHKYLELAFFESLHCNFSLILSNITMHHLNILLDLIRQNQRIGILLGLRKHNRLCISTIADQNVSKRRHSILVRALDSQVVHLLRSLVLQVLSQIDHSETFLHILASQAFDPAWDGC